MRRELRKKNRMTLFLINLGLILVVCAAFYVMGKNETVTVNSIAVNVRNGPGVSYDITSQVSRGQTLTIVEERNDWYKVKYSDDKTGWVASWLVSNSKTSANTNITATVNTEGSKLRKANSTESDILAELAKGTTVSISKEENGWSKVTVNDQTGWINTTLLDISDSTEDETTSQKLYASQDETNIREEANIDSTVVEKVSYGASLTILKTDGEWYQVQTEAGQTGYVANWVVSFAKPDSEKQTATSIAEATIILDPGHGGEDVGAETQNGTYEKEVTLATAKAVKKELEKTGANVLMTRSGDQTVSLKKRTDLSASNQADVFISLHYDSTEGTNVASGTTTYYYYNRDKSLAKLINTELEDDLPIPNRGYEYNDLYVTRENTQPALLLELGYLNSDNDAKYAVSSSYQQKVAKAITAGLKKYFNQ